MTDIVERLRLLPAAVVAHDGWIRHEGMLGLASDAATEIERLRAAIGALHDAVLHPDNTLRAAGLREALDIAIRARGPRQ